MDDNSLILQRAQEAMKTDEQLTLWFGRDIQELEIDRTKPEAQYSGQRFFDRRPEAYKLCVEMCADPGISTRQICKLLHITDDTVAGVRAREKELIKGHAETLSRKLEHGMHRAFERAVEALPQATALQAATTGAIMADKHAMINGNATAILEIKHTGNENNFERLIEMYHKAKELAAMNREMKTIEATVVEPEAVGV